MSRNVSRDIHNTMDLLHQNFDSISHPRKLDQQNYCGEPHRIVYESVEEYEAKQCTSQRANANTLFWFLLLAGLGVVMWFKWFGGSA